MRNGVSRRVVLIAMASLALTAVHLAAQSLNASQTGDVLLVKAPSGLDMIKGEALAWLKDGRTLRVDLDLSALPGPGGAAAAHARRTFVLSYDLWEERFAATMTGTPPRSIAYKTAAGAEAWCLEQVTIPLNALGPLAHAPVWVRLEYRLLADDPAPAGDDDAFSLRKLIDVLSGRKKTNVWTRAIEAGPFRLRS
jgi:hypothetical protein